MKFCPECGKDLKGSIKFCPECGFRLAKMASATVQEDLGQDVESIVDEDILEAPAKEKTTKEMGSNLEDMMEKILSNRGFTTETRIKLRGASGQFNEIDVMAKRGRQTIAVECKNYAESAKIGIEAMRDFSSKLDDLGISEGLFVTSSDFSQDAIGWAQNNPRSKKIRLWNGADLSKNFQSMILGRKVGDMKKFNDCLKPRDTIESYSEILLQNKDQIVVSRRELVFNPYYIVQFTIRDQCKMPNRQIYTIHDTGTYFVDGFTGDTLYSSSNKGGETFVKEDEQRQISEDLKDIESYKIV